MRIKMENWAENKDRMDYSSRHQKSTASPHLTAAM